LSLILYSCNSAGESIVEFKLIPVDTIELDLSGFSKNVISDLQFVETDSVLLLFLYTKSDYIDVYNLQNKKLVNRVPLIKGKQLSSFYVKNIDSIFLFYSSSFFNEYTDSLLQLVNINGSIRDIYSIDGNYLRTINNDISVLNSYYPHSIFHKIVFIKNNVFFLVSKYHQFQLGDSLSRSAELTPVLSLNTNSKKNYPVNFDYVFPKEGYFFPQAFNHYFIAEAKNKNVLFYTRYSNLIQVYNVNEKCIINHYLKSEIIDTVAPEIDKNNCTQLNFIQNKGSFFKMYYDKYNNLYFRTIIMPSKKYQNNIFIVADSNLNKIGEGIMPKGYSLEMAFYDNHVFLWNKKKTFSMEGKIFFTKFKIKQKSFNKDSVLQKITFSPIIDTSKCGIPNDDSETIAIRPFLDNYIKETSYCVLIVPFMYSCPSCKNYAVNFYSLNKDVFSNTNIYLLFDTQNISGLKNFLTPFNLGLNNEYILFDSLNLYSNYVANDYFNPRVVAVCNSRVVFDKTYKPDEMENIATPMFKYSFNQICN